MKKLVSLLVAVMAFGLGNACVKKSPVTANPSPVTVIVMDTTQALLFDAQVKISRSVYKSSFDGRIVLKPEQIAGIRSLTITCDGYKSQKAELSGDPLLIVRLVPDGKRKPHGDAIIAYGSGRTRRGEGVYYTKAVALGATATVAADAVVFEEEAAVAESDVETPHILPAHESNNGVSAGKLTAGEVNDFTKWSFWPTVIDSTHKQFVATWGIAPRHRYTVQVMNKAGYPVVNFPVQLKDKQGNTIFQAVTDNTGKAELWNGLMNEGVKELAGEWKEGMNTLIVDEPCEAPQGVDVLFVFDATGSMGDELQYLQAEMKDVIARAKEATGGLAIRTGAVVYRDHGDEYITRISRLTDDIATTQAFIDKQHANGGGDYPEAVPEALMAALNSAGWEEGARARIAFLILDAPCHEDSATLALLHDQILNAASMGVRLVPVVCSGLGESGEFLLRAIALATNGTSFFLTDDSGIGHTHLKPTTDSLKVEHLNDMLVRTIVEFSYMPDCADQGENDQMVNDEMVNDFIPNPFEVQELENNPAIPHGEGVHYILDISGKLLGIYEGDIDQIRMSQYQLPIGIYFIKSFYDGVWHTKKILIR